MEFVNSSEFWLVFHLIIITFFVYIYSLVTKQRNKLLTENKNLRKKLVEDESNSDDKNELLRILTHDLKNPISALKGSAMLIQNDPSDAESNKELSTMIIEAADEVTDRLGQFLNMQEVDDAKYQLDKTEIDVQKMLEKIVEINKPQAEAKKQSIGFEYTDDHNFVINADEQKLMAAVDNIVNNAIKYSPRDKQIDIRLKRNESKVLIEIKDEGPGFSDEDLKHVFGRFKRLSARPTGGELSSGLGLFIVKKIIELHHGKVWINSEQGKGSSFFIEV